MRRTSILVTMFVVAAPLTVRAQAPYATVSATAATPTTPAGQSQIDASTRARVVRAVAETLDRLYVYPELGKKLALDITSRWRRGRYNEVTDGHKFAKQLTNSLQEISHDKHLRVDFSPAPLPESETGQSADSVARERAQLAHKNCGFVRAEWLPGNVGYVRFDEFGDDPTVCTGTAVAAMGFLENVDAIIFDLREALVLLPG